MTAGQGVGPASASFAALNTFVVFPGTDAYVIGAQMPHVAYKSLGETTYRRGRCMWVILDARRGTMFQNLGTYAVMTAIHEKVTLGTDGYPNGELFDFAPVLGARFRSSSSGQR